MKIKGQKIEGPNVELIVIPRGGDTPDIVFHAAAVLDFGPFEAMCAEPQPPTKMLKGGKKELNLEDPNYKKAVTLYNEKRIAWMCLKSLEATEGLAWETVDMGNHRSWTNFQQELKDSGFSHVEVQRIINGVFAANCLSESRIQEARESFQLGRQAESEQSNGDHTAPESTSSGEPVSA